MWGGPLWGKTRDFGGLFVLNFYLPAFGGKWPENENIFFYYDDAPNRHFSPYRPKIAELELYLFKKNPPKWPVMGQ